MEKMDTKFEGNTSIEIDLKAILLKIKTYWYVLIIGVLIGMIFAMGYFVSFITPIYQSSAMVYLRGNSSNTISLEALQLGSQLTSDYEIIFKSRPVMEKVIKKLNLNMSPEGLSSLISISNPSDSRILKITVTHVDPEMARDIANEVTSYGMDSVREIDAQEPYVVEQAVTNTANVGLSKTKALGTGALLGFVVALGCIVLRYIFNDNVQSIEDVERTLHVPVLTVVAEDKSLAYNKKKNGKKDKVNEEGGAKDGK